MNPTAIVLIILAVWLVVAVVWMCRQKKKGKSISCGGDCSKCAAPCSQKDKKSNP